MEINVGEYVKVSGGSEYSIGIGRVISISIDKSNNKLYEIDNIKSCKLYEAGITNHSKDIIDLIEVGDYVNGREVTSFGYDHNDKVIYVNTISCLSFENEDIETVLTHEQFEANAYKIEKER